MQGFPSSSSPFGYPAEDNGYGAAPFAVGQPNYYQQCQNAPEGFDVMAKASSHPRRKKLNILSVLVSFVVPVMLFTFLLLLLSSNINYHYPWSCFLVADSCLLIVVYFGIRIASSVKKKGERALRSVGAGAHEPTWFIFLFLTCLLAWVSAVYAGGTNFTQNMEPFFQMQGMGTYTDVDPTSVQGQQLMDAGRVVFTNSSRIDVTKANGFKGLHMFCVAPVTSGNATLASYDFWAVGTDCCDSGSPNYHCGEFHNPKVHAGMRLLRDNERPFYRLAVQQAEAAFNIKAAHPIFITWMQDPIGQTDQHADDGYNYSYYWVVSFFVLQLVMVVAASISFDSYR